MGGAWNTCGRVDKCIQHFLSEGAKFRIHLENLSLLLDRKIMLKRISEVEYVRIRA
jgi:hypothetical protein